jgi:hypothetical protein
MQFIELLGALFLAGVALLLILPIVTAQGPAPHSALRIGIGLGAGLVGALVVLVLRTDLVPDDVESTLRLPLLALVVVVVLFVLSRGGGRRRG